MLDAEKKVTEARKTSIAAEEPIGPASSPLVQPIEGTVHAIKERNASPLASSLKSTPKSLAEESKRKAQLTPPRAASGASLSSTEVMCTPIPNLASIATPVGVRRP